MAYRVTNDHGKAGGNQYRVVASKGHWHLLYDSHVVGEAVISQFRVQKIVRDVAIYPGATLDYALERFNELSDASNGD